jgi:hypothetical protein
MAFSLKKARLYPLQNPAASDKRNLQVVELSIGRIAGDTVISIFEDSSVFYTNTLANPLTDVLAKNLKAKLGSISEFVESVVSVSLMNDTDVFVPVKTTPPVTTEYNLKNALTSVDTFKPVVTIGTAGTVGTSLKLNLVVSLKSGKDAVTFN